MTSLRLGPYQGHRLLHHSPHQQVWEATSLGGPPGGAAARLRRAQQPLWLRLLQAQDSARPALLRRARLLRRAWHPQLQRVYDAGATPEGIFLAERPPSGRPMMQAGQRASGQFRHTEPLVGALLGVLAHLKALGLERALAGEPSLWWGGAQPHDPEAPLTLVGCALPSPGGEDLPTLAGLARRWAGPRGLSQGLLEALAQEDPLRAWCHHQRHQHPQRARWGSLTQQSALELARRLLYEQSTEALGSLALLRPELIARPPLADYLWGHLEGPLREALASTWGQPPDLAPPLWQCALLARLPQARGALEEHAEQGRHVDLWLCHAPWPEPLPEPLPEESP